MTREDINNIISVICPNDEDFEKPIISPKYLKQELEHLALEQEPCEDCISRHAAKKIIFDEFEGWPTDDEVARLKRLTRQLDNLPSITPQEPKTDILDKIRAEIKTMPSELTRDGRRMVRQVNVFEIVDKYRESEEKNDHNK